MLGIQKSGPFDVPGSIARSWLTEPLNPNGISNREVLKPYWNGDDVTGRPRDYWLIDLPLKLSEREAALFEKPFHHVQMTPDENGLTVQRLREALGERAHDRWWEPHWPRPEMRKQIKSLARYMVTPETAEHRVFTWLSYPTLPDKNLIVIARSDDLMFGLLQSKFHEFWSLRKGSDLQDRPRYTHTSTFATFPFPEGFSPNIQADLSADHRAARAIAAAAKELYEAREAWLWPADLFRLEAEIADGFPNRRLPIDGRAQQILQSRTLTSLYNSPPHWLVEAHHKLDRAVAEAYGYTGEFDEEPILEFLLELNLGRA
jgi:hypothetical protein